MGFVNNVALDLMSFIVLCIDRATTLKCGCSSHILTRSGAIHVSGCGLQCVLCPEQYMKHGARKVDAPSAGGWGL